MIRALFLGLSALALSACGFSPMHATGETSLANIAVELKKGPDVTDNQAGFYMTQRLRDRIGKASDTPDYVLRLGPRYNRGRLGITGDDVASRYDVTLSSTYELVQSQTGKVVDRGRVSAITTFGAPAGPFGIVTADDTGTRQAAKEIADRLVIVLAKHFAENPS
jgi:LPS-assembly lipoprotein